MKNSIKKQTILEYFNELLPNAHCELNYNSDYELLIAVVLSAQATDKKVNEVTSKLFNEFKTLEDLNNASNEEILKYIKVLGLSQAKLTAIKDILYKLIHDYDSKVPSSKKELLKMKGVGNKVANVILIELFNIPEFPVDTHIYRLAKRLGITKENDSIIITETKLKKYFPKDTWIKLHHQFIHFGRYYCKAINPKCENCKLQKYCHYFKHNHIK